MVDSTVSGMQTCFFCVFLCVCIPLTSCKATAIVDSIVILKGGVSSGYK